MAVRLKGLELERIDLVDAPANPGSRVVLIKRDRTVKKQDTPIVRAVGDKGAGTVTKQNLMKNLTRAITMAVSSVFKGADPADIDEGAEEMAQGKGAAYAAMKAHAGELEKAVQGFGDLAKLPADHPAHKMKSMHDELTKAIADCDAQGDPDAGDDELGKAVATPYGPQTGKPGLAKRFVDSLVSKRLEPIQKALDEAKLEVAEAQKIAKAERDARSLDGVKVDLRKFDKLSIDVDKEAQGYADLKAANPTLYAATLEKLAGAQAMIAKSNGLLEELGSGREAIAGATAWAEIEAKAAEVVTKGEKGMTKAKAIDFVMKKHPELVKKYYRESGQSVS